MLDDLKVVKRITIEAATKTPGGKACQEPLGVANDYDWGGAVTTHG